MLVLLGAPGAGKGTQAEILAPRLNLLHLATGDMFRAAAEQGTPIGLEAKAYMDRGELVPDDVTVRMLLERLTAPDARQGVLLDGFPRTPAQAGALDAALAERNAGVEEAILIDVPPEELVTRLSGRLVCRAGGHIYNEISKPPRVPGICDIDGSELYEREDDKVETVRARLRQQIPDLLEVCDHYKAQGKLRTVDGTRPIDGVTDELVAELMQASGSAR
ncbi:MAG TPA: adenylate kinase [Candidatus Limnocylindrales bacterium]